MKRRSKNIIFIFPVIISLLLSIFTAVDIFAEDDTTPPNTSITSKPPSLTNSNSASFEFSANETGCEFKTYLDGSWSGWSSSKSKSYSSLSDGEHTFKVKARDAAGNEDSSPASYTWKVDTTPPNTSFSLSDTTEGDNGWYKAAKGSLSASDPDSNNYHSGVANTYYKINNASSYSTYSTSFNIPEGSSQKVYFYSVDNAGLLAGKRWSSKLLRWLI